MDEFLYTLSNYRTFEESTPATIKIRRGFTALVGPNNSGKTNVLKSIFEFKKTFQVACSDRWPKLLCMSKALTAPIPNLRGEDIGGRIEDLLFGHQTNRQLTVSIDLIAAAENEISKIEFARSAGRNEFASKLFLNGQEFTSPADISLYNVTDKCISLGPDVSISVSRALESLTCLQNSIYMASFRNVVEHSGGPYYDLNIGTDFVGNWQQWQQGQDRGKRSVINKVISDVQDLFKIDKFNIMASADGNSLIIERNGESFSLGEMGSGFTQIIIAFASAAIQGPHLILIDEPEAGLHPSLQIDFLSRLGSYAKFGVVLTTHSIGLARSVTDNIYSFKEDRGRSVVEEFASMGGLEEFLGEMSYEALGVDAVLLVEGPTDLLVFNELLKKVPEKSQDVLLLHMGGDSGINGSKSAEFQLQQLTNRARKVYAIIDSERDKANGPPKATRKEFSDLCSKCGIDICVTERTGTENYFTTAAIRKVKGRTASQIGPYGKVGSGWVKQDNWRIAKELNWNDIAQTDIGNFLQKV